MKLSAKLAAMATVVALSIPAVASADYRGAPYHRAEIADARADLRDARRDLRRADNRWERREARRDLRDARHDLRDARHGLRDARQGRREAYRDLRRENHRLRRELYREWQADRGVPYRVAPAPRYHVVPASPSLGFTFIVD